MRRGLPPGTARCKTVRPIAGRWDRRLAGRVHGTEGASDPSPGRWRLRGGVVFLRRGLRPGTERGTTVRPGAEAMAISSVRGIGILRRGLSPGTERGRTVRDGACFGQVVGDTEERATVGRFRSSPRTMAVSRVRGLSFCGAACRRGRKGAQRCGLLAGDGKKVR